MEDLLIKINKFKKERNDEVFDNIVDSLKGFLKPYLKKVDACFRDDLYQEILMGLFKSCLLFKIIDFNKIKSNSNYDFYYKNFLNEKKIEIDEEDFVIYFNLITFIKFINEMIINVIKDFVKSRYYFESKNTDSLNILIYDEELINLIFDSSYEEEVSLIKAFKLLDNDEIKFLDAFLKNGQVLSQREVAIKFGITQQAVSKKLNKIKKKVNEGR